MICYRCKIVEEMADLCTDGPNKGGRSGNRIKEIEREGIEEGGELRTAFFFSNEVTYNA